MSTTIPSISLYPPAPNPFTDTATEFGNKGAAFVAAQEASVPELNAFAAAANTLGAEVEADAAQVAADSAIAAAAAVTAVNAPGTSSTATDSRAIQTTLPASLSFTTQTGKQWVNQHVKISPTTNSDIWMIGTVSTYNSGTGAFTVKITHAQGVGTYASWNITLATPIVSTVANAVVPKSSSFAVAKADKGRVYHCAAALTASLESVASLESDFYAYFKHTGATNTAVTITGVEAINGASSLLICQGEEYRVYVDNGVLAATKTGGAVPMFKMSYRIASGNPATNLVLNNITAAVQFNTVDFNTIAGASLASNDVTLPAGTYEVDIQFPVLSLALGQMFLYNQTDNAYLLDGTNCANGSLATTPKLALQGRFTLTATKTLRVRYYVTGGTAPGAVSAGRGEVYEEAIFRKVA